MENIHAIMSVILAINITFIAQLLSFNDCDSVVPSWVKPSREVLEIPGNLGRSFMLVFCRSKAVCTVSPM